MQARRARPPRRRPVRQAPLRGRVAAPGGAPRGAWAAPSAAPRRHVAWRPQGGLRMSSSRPRIGLGAAQARRGRGPARPRQAKPMILLCLRSGGGPVQPSSVQRSPVVPSPIVQSRAEQPSAGESRSAQLTGFLLHPINYNTSRVFTARCVHCAFTADRCAEGQKHRKRDPSPV